MWRIGGISNSTPETSGTIWNIWGRWREIETSCWLCEYVLNMLYYFIAFNVTVWLFSSKLLLICFWLWIVGSEEWCGTYSCKISKKWGKISATSKVGLLPIRFLIEVLRHLAFYLLQYSGICQFFLQHCSIQNPPMFLSITACACLTVLSK